MTLLSLKHWCWDFEYCKYHKQNVLTSNSFGWKQNYQRGISQKSCIQNENLNLLTNKWFFSLCVLDTRVTRGADSPGGELDQLVGEDAGQTTYTVRLRGSGRDSSPRYLQLLAEIWGTALWGRLWMFSLSEPCSEPPLLRMMHWAVTVIFLPGNN